MSETQTAGRELDAEVHRLIFGQCPHLPQDVLDEEATEEEREAAEEGWGWPTKCDLCGGRFAGGHYDAGKYAERPFPRYSTDLVAAWQVVEKLGSLGFWVSLSHNGNTRAAPWDFRAVSKDERKRECHIEETPALAICKVALAVVVAEP